MSFYNPDADSYEDSSISRTSVESDFRFHQSLFRSVRTQLRFF